MKYLADRTRQNRQKPPLSINIFSKLLEMGVTKPTKLDYYSCALCKITKLALVGYKSNIGAQSALRAFFVRKISMHSHVMAELERDTFMCAGSLCYLSTNPFQLRHPHLVVNGEAPLKNIGAH